MQLSYARLARRNQLSRRRFLCTQAQPFYHAFFLDLHFFLFSFFFDKYEVLKLEKFEQILKRNLSNIERVWTYVDKQSTDFTSVVDKVQSTDLHWRNLAVLKRRFVNSKFYTARKGRKS